MFIEWIGDTLAKGAVVTVLLAGAGWLFKQQISAWLSQDLERKKATYVQELEAKKADYQRDLESYRVSLIAAAERSKAESEVKKAAALRIVEKKFMAFDQLHSAIVGNAVAALYIAGLPSTQKTIEHSQSMISRVTVLNNASNVAEIFLTAEEHRVMVSYRQKLSEMLSHCLVGSPSLVQPQMSQTQTDLFSVENRVDHIVRMHVEQMMSMSL